MDRYHFMKEALALAFEAKNHGEVPVGCVIIKDSEIIAKGRNHTEEYSSPTRHAEIEAIEKACEVLQSANLTGCEMYVTLEPCPMCAGAIIASKIDKVVFGAFDRSYGACGTVTNVFSLPNIHRAECFGGIMEDECSEVLSEFFKRIREEAKS